MQHSINILKKRFYSIGIEEIYPHYCYGKETLWFADDLLLGLCNLTPIQGLTGFNEWDTIAAQCLILPTFLAFLCNDMGEKILKFVVEIRNGMGQAMVVSPDRAYVRPETKSFQVDNSNLRNDTRRIGNDLKKKLKQYSNGEPSYQR
ncbi:MAG: hypothetical protein HY016_02630 [Nitrosomonadales bacterium]|nr:hypothetical protein [Nitrosomonadales bacterium]